MEPSGKIKSYEMHPIGLVQILDKIKSETPIQPPFSPATGWVEIYSDYCEGFTDLDGFPHI